MRVVTDAGESIDLGIVADAPTIGITDYSKRTTDDYGVTTVVERGFSHTMSVKLGVEFGVVDALQRRLADLRATSALWIADDAYAGLSVRGFYKDFDLDLSTPPLSICTLTVEGVAEVTPVADAGGDPAPDGTVSTLQLLQPVIITDSVLVASNVAEADAPEWSATTSYPLGARVIKAATHRVYESAGAANAGNDPAGVSGDWLDVGPTNRWAMFDQALGAVTRADGSISVTLDPGTVDGVALLNVTGDTVRVRATGYDRSLNVVPGTMSFLDLPAGAGQVTVTVTGSAAVTVETLLIGRLVALGVTEASATAGITDYSRKDVDDFGEVTIVQRAWAKRMTAKALIGTDALNIVFNRIATVRARPSLWIGQSGMDSLTVYGFFKDFSIEIGASVSKLSLSIEGLSVAAKVAPLVTPVTWPTLPDPTGTKPADNADVTADNTAKDTKAVAGTPADKVVSDLNVNAAGIIAQALRQDDLSQITDARTFVDGQAVSTVFQAFRNAQTSTNTAINSALNLLGAKTADGTGWVLGLSTVQIGGGKTLGQKLDEVGAASGGVAATVQSLQEALIDADGSGHAKAVLSVTAGGFVTGYTATADGSGGSFAILASRFSVVDDSTGTAVTPFLITNGVVYAPTLVVSKLTVNTAVVPARASGSASIAGNNTGPTGQFPSSLMTVLTVVIHMPIPGWIECQGTGKQSFNNGLTNMPWGFELTVNDNVLTESVSAGSVPGDSVTLQGAYYAGAAGDYTVKMLWNAPSAVTLQGRALFVKGFTNTQ